MKTTPKTRRKGRGVGPGEEHWAWTGDNATYNGAHLRVKRKRGKPSEHQCTDCGAQAYHWSYDHADPAERIDDDGRRYSLDVDHYAPRCTACHKRFDCAALLQERGGTFSATPRCGKPITSRRTLALLDNPVTVPTCARPANHASRCSPLEFYQRKLERGRKPGRQMSGELRIAPGEPTPRCGEPVKVRSNEEPDICGRPIGHPSAHLGSRAYRRMVTRSVAARAERIRERKSA